MEDRTLILGCTNGDQGCWETLVSRYTPLLRGAVGDVLRRFLGAVSTPEVHDLVQSIFVHLMDDDCRRLKTYRGESHFGPWLRSVAIRFTINQLRRRKPFQEKSLDEIPFVAEADPEEEPLPLSPEQINEALDRLPPRDRLILKMRYFDRMAYRAIARVLDVGVNTLCPMLARARIRLREIMNKLCTI